MLQKLLPYLVSGGVGFIIRDATSGFINEWIREFWVDVRKRKKLKYNIGKKILSLILLDLKDLTKEPPINEIEQLKYHVYGHSKKVFGYIDIYSKMRQLLRKEISRLLKKTPKTMTLEDLNIINGFKEDLSAIIHVLTMEAHYFMRNNILSYRFGTLEYVIKKRWITKRVRKEMDGNSACQLICKKQEARIKQLQSQIASKI
ncbi:hypothetical protein KKB40_05520 [Patescibacteria group bacterium]|nr:hypothetical protein [Patescibacteria group bacterium]